MDDQLIIEQYVAGKLTPDERAAFEKRLAQEQDLAESLRLYQMTQGFMAQREPALEQLLNTMGDKYFPVRPWYQKWHLWLVFCLLIVIAMTVIYSKKTAAPLNTSPLTKEKPIDTENTATPMAPSSGTPDKPAPSDDPSPAELPPPRTPDKTKSASPPIAAADPSIYETNPVLEGLWQEQLRNNLYFELLSPQRNSSFLAQPQMAFKLAARTTIPPPYELRMYSNRPTDFYKDERVLNTLIVEANRTADTFAIDHTINLPLTTGLYYWLLVSDSEKLLTTGKFKIIED